MGTERREEPDATAGRLPPGPLADGRYRVERLLGAWGVRALYAVTNSATDRPAILAEFALTGAVHVQERVGQLTRLEHPILPIIQESFQHSDALFLVINLADGMPLDAALALQHGESIGEAQAITWGIQLCDGLSFLHRQNPAILVADLAPSAAFLTPYNRLKLVDLGMMLGLYTPAAMVGVLDPGYAAPEVYLGRADARSDIYALGALLHRVLTGSEPATYAPGTLPSLNIQRPDLRPELIEAVSRALALTPDERWPDAASFGAALRQAEAAMQMAAEAPAPASALAPAPVVDTPRDEGPAEPPDLPLPSAGEPDQAIAVPTAMIAPEPAELVMPAPQAPTPPTEQEHGPDALASAPQARRRGFLARLFGGRRRRGSR
ncbi:MAG TPA: protein kinase [Ktedonobacterales bacterium]